MTARKRKSSRFWRFFERPLSLFSSLPLPVAASLLPRHDGCRVRTGRAGGINAAGAEAGRKRTELRSVKFLSAELFHERILNLSDRGFLSRTTKYFWRSPP
jgi:hypothetical protein